MNIIHSKYENLNKRFSGSEVLLNKQVKSKKQSISSIGKAISESNAMLDWQSSANESAYIPENKRSSSKKRKSLLKKSTRTRSSISTSRTTGPSAKNSLSGPSYDGSATESDTFNKHPIEYSVPRYQANTPFEEQELESDVSVEMIYAVASRNKLPRGQKTKSFSNPTDNHHYWTKFQNLQGNLKPTDLCEIVNLYHTEYPEIPISVRDFLDKFGDSIQRPRVMSRIQYNKNLTPQDLEMALELMTANKLFDFLEYKSKLSFECILLLAHNGMDKETITPYLRKTLQNELQNVQYCEASYDTKLQLRRDLCNRAGDTGVLPFEELISIMTSQKFLVCLENNVYE